jgi:hypothetical protein
MTSKKNKDLPAEFKTVQWIARIYGALLVVLCLYITITEFIEEIENHSPNPVATLISGQYFLAITLTVAFAGLVLAYWKEGWGGGISLVTLIILFIGWQDFHPGFIVAMFLASIPSILYLIYWWLEFHYPEEGAGS